MATLCMSRALECAEGAMNLLRWLKETLKINSFIHSLKAS
jgi:hypothetical protein